MDGVRVPVVPVLAGEAQIRTHDGAIHQMRALEDGVRLLTLRRRVLQAGESVPQMQDGAAQALHKIQAGEALIPRRTVGMCRYFGLLSTVFLSVFYIYRDFICRII